MQKSMFITIVLCSILSASSFDEFLDLALRSNPNLKTSSIAIEQSTQEAKQLLNYENPSLEFEVSNFKPKVGESRYGSRIAIDQPVRLWGVGDDKKSFLESDLS